MFTPFASLAQEPLGTPYWTRLSQADAKIKSSEVVWSRHMHSAAKSGDTEKALAAEGDRLRMEGKTPQDIQHQLELSRKIAEQVSGGYDATQTFKFEFDGSNVYCDVSINALSGSNFSSTATGGKLHVVNMNDGENNIALTGFTGSGSKSGIPNVGELKRDPKEFLPNCANFFAYPIFLYGAPITQSFTPTDTIIKPGPGNTIILEKTFQNPVLNGRSSGFEPQTARLTISTDSWRPVLMEVINPVDHQLWGRCRILDYRHYPGGVWFPSKIITERVSRAGLATVSSEHVLVVASFNEATALNHIKQGIAPGTQLSDFRFPDHPVVYRLKNNRIPSDQHVLAMIKQQEQSQQQATRERQQQIVRSVSLILLPLVVAVAATLLLYYLRRGHK